LTRRWRAAATALVATVLLCGGGANAAWAETAGKNASAADRGSCNRSAFRVIVDVGHTAEVPGAKSARGVPEYEFNLRLARQVEQKLIDAGFARTVLLITAEAPARGLFKRTVHANHLPADLFVSIHHDSVPAPLLEKWEYEGRELRFCDRFPGHSIFISHDNPARAASLQFGRLLGGALKARGLKYTPHYTDEIMGNRRRILVDAEAGVYRYDQLVVLRRTQMPAVLLEAGSIVNREEELLLGTPEHQATISEAVAEAVEGFCAARSVQLADRRRARAAAARPPAAAEQATSAQRR
jgi:N-acetylmuramoyl-L-alanine amidase